MNQDKIFFAKEGDNWFKRNRQDIHDDRFSDPVLALLAQYKLKPKKVLEVGAANGWRLAKIADSYGSQCIGIEPSKAAVADGKKRFKKIALKTGLASALPVNEEFDLVIVHYVLHWVSREELMGAVVEIDRVVADGGYLVIGDFDPFYPTRTRYHHLPNDEVYTYKLDYANIFAATALYRSIARMTFLHENHEITHDKAGEDRGVVSLLKKSLHGHLHTSS